MATITQNRYGTPQPPQAPPPIWGQIGISGLPVYAGRIYDEFLHELSGYRAARVYREMADNDPTIGAMRFMINQTIRRVVWTITPADPPNNETFLQECLDDMDVPFRERLSDILSFLDFGYSVHEIIYKRRDGTGRLDSPSRFNDGRIGWAKFLPLTQESFWRWEYDEDGNAVAFTQHPAPDYRERIVPLLKCLHCVTTHRKDNPEGQSWLRNAYRPWYYLKRLENLEAIGIERDLNGIPLFWVPPEYLREDATDEEKAVVAQMMRIGQNLRRDEQAVVIMPNAYQEQGKRIYDFELISSNSTRPVDTDSVIRRKRQEIAATALADFLLLGADRVGSLAMADAKIKLLASSLETVTQIVADAMNTQAIPRLFALNGLPLHNLPRLTPSKIVTGDLTELGNFIGRLAMARAPLFPDADLENVLRERAGLPPVAPDEAAERPQGPGALRREQLLAAAAPIAGRAAADASPGGTAPAPITPPRRNPRG